MKGQRANQTVPLRSSSFSDLTILTRYKGEVTDLTDGQVKEVGGMAKLRRRQLRWEETPAEFEGRIGEVITATSNASVDAMHIP